MSKIKEAAEQEKKELEQGYDQAHSESGEVYIEVLGKRFAIPKSTPAWVPLFIARHGRGDNKEVPSERYLDFIVKVLGNDITDHIVDSADNSFSTDDFKTEVIDKITSVWGQGEQVKK
jgi:hypothetical protein